MRHAGALALVAWLSACSVDDCEGVACGVCQSPINLSFVDADTKEAVDKVSVTGDLSGSCDALAGQTTCHLGDSGTKPGTYALTISAPGYATATRTITVGADTAGGCCSCGYAAVTQTVPLKKG